MKIAEIGELLALVRATVEHAGRRLAYSRTDPDLDYVTSSEYPREVKALADVVLEQEILAQLTPTGISVLSEESGRVDGECDSGYRFIVDPLDGTFNYLHNLGPWAVSVALWREATPVFGVVYAAADDAIFWGGPNLGAFCNDDPIAVSETSDRNRASVCTGVPARADLEDPVFRNQLWEVVSTFGKVRMFGSAAVSLVLVASGVADAYCEKGIMIWDVAAGVAIVEGAGGSKSCLPGRTEFSVDVFASNGRLAPAMDRREQ